MTTLEVPSAEATTRVTRGLFAVAGLAALLGLASCGGGDDPKGACVRGSGVGATCGDDFTYAQCNLVNGDKFYEGRTCRDLGFR